MNENEDFEAEINLRMTKAKLLRMKLIRYSKTIVEFNYDDSNYQRKLSETKTVEEYVHPDNFSFILEGIAKALRGH